MRILAFAASHRKESINRKLAKLAANKAELYNAHIDFIEYGTLNAPIYDDETYDEQALPAMITTFAARLNEADGIILASPEYNWSFPGSLKNIIDWVSTITPNPFAGKTALLLSASPSLRGGAQGLVHLKAPLMALGVYIFPRLFTLSRASDAFDGKNALINAELDAELDQIVKDFMHYTHALKNHSH